MDIFVYVAVIGFCTGIALYGVCLGVMCIVEKFRNLKEEVAVLEKDNLQFARTNEALRELLHNEYN